MPDPHHLVGIMASIYHDGKYLMMIRGENESEGPGDLSFVSGKTELGMHRDNPLEETVHRETMEEVGITVTDLVYVRSHAFTLSRGPNLLLAEFLCRWDSGTAHPADPEEVESVAWMTPEEVENHPKSPSWTIATLAAMEAKRIEQGGRHLPCRHSEAGTGREAAKTERRPRGDVLTGRFRLTPPRGKCPCGRHPPGEG